MPNSLCIIVPVLNESTTISDKLTDLRQLHEQSTLIFVDADSSDNTSQLLADQGFTVIQTSNKGRGAQLAVGAKQASTDSELLLFMHIDTQLPNNYQHLIQQTLHTHHWGHFTLTFDSMNAIVKLIAIMMNLRSRLTGISTGDQCMFVKKDLFLRYADDMVQHPLMEDIYLSKTLKKYHQRGGIIHQPVITSARYWEKHGIIRTIVKMWGFRLLYFCGASPHALYKRYYKH